MCNFCSLLGGSLCLKKQKSRRTLTSKGSRNDKNIFSFPRTTSCPFFSCVLSFLLDTDFFFSFSFSSIFLLFSDESLLPPPLQSIVSTLTLALRYFRSTGMASFPFSLSFYFLF